MQGSSISSSYLVNAVIVSEVTTRSDVLFYILDAPLPPPAAYDFENCDDPFGSKKDKMAASPPIRAKPAALEIDYDNVENPFGSNSKVGVSFL